VRFATSAAAAAPYLLPPPLLFFFSRNRAAQFFLSFFFFESGFGIALSAPLLRSVERLSGADGLDNLFFPFYRLPSSSYPFCAYALVARATRKSLFAERRF